MRPDRADIAIPPFGRSMGWLGSEPLDATRLAARGPVLVHFFDAAHLHSVRTLTYLGAWHERYAPLGLSVVGAHVPRWPFAADAAWVERQRHRLGVEHPVAVDSERTLWAAYGCRGWPSLFLWGRGGALRWYHFGEGAYPETEQAIRTQLGPAAAAELQRVAPVGVLRAADHPEARIARPTPEVFPGSPREPWEATPEADTLSLGYEAGGAHATFEGAGAVQVELDGRFHAALELADPGLVELAAHPHHERHRLRLVLAPGVRLWSVSFAPGLAGED